MNRRDKQFLQQIGFRVRERRTARNLTQAQLADLCGLHRTFIGSVERGERTGAVLGLEAIAASLRIPVAELVADPVEKTT